MIYDDNRATWGASANTNPKTVTWTQRTEFMTHWNGDATGLTEDDPHTRCLAFVKNVQDFHQESRGFADIGYNFLLCPHARVIEGRGGDYEGAHCTGHNVSAYSCMVMTGTKDGVDEVTSDEMLARLARLEADLENLIGRDLRMLVHSDGASTACPGNQLREWVHAGMVPPQQDPVEVGFGPLLEAIARVEKNLSALTARVGEGESRLSSQLSSQLITQIDELNAVRVSMDSALTAVPSTVTNALKASLGGFEMSARYTLKEE